MHLQTQPGPKDYSAYFLLFAIGLLVFFTITFTFSFKEKVFQAFFDKPFTFASEQDDTPKVDLIAGLDNSFKRGMLNVAAGKSDLKLKWKAENAGTCLGRFWSNVKKADSWTGVKGNRGGDYVITEALPVGIYIYSINCANDSGDSAGSSITINVGAKPTNLQPHIISFQAFGADNHQYEINKLNKVDINTKIKIVWSSINAGTPYGVCAANGSWPTIYQNTGNLKIVEPFVLDQAKIYKYSIFCSNENGYDSQEVSFSAK